jgi:twitching motility protein PilT
MKVIDDYLARAVEEGASDIHLVSGQRPTIRVSGQLHPIEGQSLAPEPLRDAIFSLLAKEQRDCYIRTLELDFSYAAAGARFRMNLHQQEGTIGLAARLIPRAIPTPEQLRLEPQITGVTDLLDGLVLVVGPSGHGKSTTLASLIEEINKKRRAHIITIEDPVEFVFEEKQSLIEQREIGVDTHSFAEALKHVLRQDPNVILVGEMRDPETIATVLTAAETGHLVFSSLHTASAAEAIERIVDVFEGTRQKQVLTQLSAVLRVVVAQQLLPKKGGGRIGVHEILVNTPAISSLIRENNIAQIRSAIQTGGRDGMMTMENSIKAALAANLIERDVAERRVQRQRKV